MADAKISALPAVVTPVGTDEFAVNQGGTTKKVTLTQLGGLPGGVDTNVQFNDGGIFGGDVGLTFNKTNKDFAVDTDVLFVDGVNDRAAIGTNVPIDKFQVSGGDISVYDTGTLAAESLDDPSDFSTGKWVLAGDFAAVGTDAVFTFSGGTGTITQIAADLNVSTNENLYQFQYTISASTVANAVMIITNSFADQSISLPISVATTTVIFRSNDILPSDFVISVSGATSGAFTLTDVTLKRIDGGAFRPQGKVFFREGASLNDLSFEITNNSALNMGCYTSTTGALRWVVASTHSCRMLVNGDFQAVRYGVFNTATPITLLANSVSAGVLRAGSSNTITSGNIFEMHSDNMTTLEAFIKFDGGMVINEQGNDSDTRIEGVGQANALFVQGSDGFVGSGTNAPINQLAVIKTGAPNAPSQINFGAVVGEGGFLTSLNDSYGFISAGGRFNGTNWIATSTTAVLFGGAADTIHFYANTGLTKGNSFTPTEVLRMHPTQVIFNESGNDQDFRVEGIGAAEALFVQGSDGFVGLGTNTPVGMLHVQKNDAGAVTALPSADELIIENSADTGLALLTPTANVARIVHSTPLDQDGCVILFDGTARFIAFETAGNEQVRITSSGRVGIGPVTTPTAKLHVDQLNSSAAIPVLTLDQADIDDRFIKFVGTSAADGTRSISSSTTETSAKFGAVRVDINGTTKWIRIYDNAT